MKELTKILKEADAAKIVSLTGISNVMELLNPETPFETVEKKWVKELSNSESKAKEWLFRQAVGTALCYKALGDKEKFSSWITTHLGISNDLANKRRRAGELILDIRVRNLLNPDSAPIDLPTSYSNLVELSTLSDSEIPFAVEAGLFCEDVTNSQIREFKESRKEEKKDVTELQERIAQQKTKKIEAELLAFDYNDNVPEWIIGKIEDMVVQLGLEMVLKSPKMRFTQGESTFVVELTDNTWDCVEVLGEPAEKSKQTESEKKDKPKKEKFVPPEQKIYVSEEFDKALAYFGINLFHGYVETWALKALQVAGDEMYTNEVMRAALDASAEILRKK